MDIDKIGQFIKNLRIKNNLTQKELADKYNVSYQAVSKWENGKSIPDLTIIKKMSEDFNFDINELLDAKNKVKESKFKKEYFLLLIFFLILIVIIFWLIFQKNSFEFKTLSSACHDFNISGSIAYNKEQSSIYITNVTYCGGNDLAKYQNIVCTLYEEDKNTYIKISENSYEENEPIKLENYLQTVEFVINDYESKCKNYQNNSLFIEIKAMTEENIINTYKIPLTLNSDC